jgi:hypothetical protein
MRADDAGRRADELRQRLRRVYWIGGGPGGGKSTVARALAERYGLTVYATDDVMADHARRSSAEEAPLLERFKAMDMDERWLTRPPQTMLETFHWFQGECFQLIVEDLSGLPAATPVVAEGFRLLPRLVQPLLADDRHAVWLLPTPRLRAAALERRGSAWTIPGSTSDPERAAANLGKRDRLFTDRLVAEASMLGLPVLRLDTGGPTVDELVDRVAAMFGLAAPSGAAGPDQVREISPGRSGRPG